jgi:dihydropteroate synthase
MISLATACCRQVAKVEKGLVSVDTFRASVAREAIRAGARMVNDVTAGRKDRDMLRTVRCRHSASLSYAWDE